MWLINLKWHLDLIQINQNWASEIAWQRTWKRTSLNRLSLGSQSVKPSKLAKRMQQSKKSRRPNPANKLFKMRRQPNPRNVAESSLKRTSTSMTRSSRSMDGGQSSMKTKAQMANPWPRSRKRVSATKSPLKNREGGRGLSFTISKKAWKRWTGTSIWS